VAPRWGDAGSGRNGRPYGRSGRVALYPRGWKHITAAEGVSFVVSVSCTNPVISRNGYHSPKPPDPLRHANPEALLTTATTTTPHFLLHCDTLRFYAQRLSGAIPSGSSGQGVWVIPLSGTVGVRCGGVVTTLKPTEIVQVTAHRNWHLFGKADVVWAALP